MEKSSLINDFNLKNKIKGKIGTFKLKDKKVIQDLNIYKTEKNKFIKYLIFFFKFLNAKNL